MRRGTRRPLAAADILDLRDHTAEDSIEQADRWMHKLDEKFMPIVTRPLTGRAGDQLAANLRGIPFGGQVDFHEPAADGIDGVRVLHRACDIDAVLGEDQEVAPSLVEGPLLGFARAPGARVRHRRSV